MEFTEERLGRMSHLCVGLRNKLHRLFKLFVPKRDKRLIKGNKWATVNHK